MKRPKVPIAGLVLAFFLVECPGAMGPAAKHAWLRVSGRQDQHVPQEKPEGPTCDPSASSAIGTTSSGISISGVDGPGIPGVTLPRN